MIAKREITSRPQKYRVIRTLGNGMWGKVEEAENEWGERVAIKSLEMTVVAQEQAKARNLDPMKIMRRESVTLAESNCANIVPRRFEIGEDEEPRVIMPVYDKFLSDILDDNEQRKSLNQGLSLEEVIDISKGISQGLSQLHTILKRAYGDLKPDNVAIDKDHGALLNDLGTTSMGFSISPRTNVGFEYTRAPEMTNSKPTKEGDVWAFGSLLYRILTGNYVFEDEIHSAGNAEKYFSTTNENELEKTLNKYVKQVPRKWRKLVESCLSISPRNRLKDGKILTQELYKTIDNLDTWKKVKDHTRKWTLPILLPTLLASIATYNVVTYEPTKLTMPVNIQEGTKGLLFKPGINDNIEFESEAISDLPVKKPVGGAIAGGILRTAKGSTENRVVAYLVKTHHFSMYAIPRAARTTEFQENNYYQYLAKNKETIMRHNGMVGEINVKWACAVETGIKEARNDAGVVDLEDTLAIARLGPEKIKLAKKLSGSDDYREYRFATDKEGIPVIEEKERKIINQWIAYTHTDTDIAYDTRLH